MLLIDYGAIDMTWSLSLTPCKRAGGANGRGDGEGQRGQGQEADEGRVAEAHPDSGRYTPAAAKTQKGLISTD